MTINSLMARPNVFLVYRGPTGSVPWTAVGFVFSGAFEAINEGGSDEHLMLGNGLKYLRSIKIEVNWFPYLQTLLPKFHDVEELGPPECWAVVVVVPEWWWPWQISQLASHHYQLQMVLIWAAMGDFLVFSALPHPLRHFLRHWPQLVPPQIVSLVTEFAVDRWTTRRGPLGGVEDQLSSTFSGLWLTLRWIVFFWSPLQCLEHRAKRGGKNGIEGHSSLSFFKLFQNPLACPWLLPSTAPVGPPPQPGSGEALEAPPLSTSGVHRGNGGRPNGFLRPFQANPGWQLPPPSPARPRIHRKGLLPLCLTRGTRAPHCSLPNPWISLTPWRIGIGRCQGWSPRWTKLGSQVLRRISELLIQKGDLQATPINFDFLCAASKDWSHWVDREILDSDFWDNLVDAEVHWAILISRSCNMFRDTEALRELLRRWCPSTHTFFFSWGELTPTLEDVANHWMLPILGEYSFSNIKLSAAEEEIAAVLKKYSSTRLSGWPSTFINYKKAPIRRAAFILYWLSIRISVGHCFPLAPLFLGHLYSQLNLLHDCEIAGDSCFILSTVFNTSALQTFFWEHSTSYIYAARDRSAAWGRFSDLPQKFLDQFPSFRDNLPLVYRWAGLKPRDHDLVEALDYEENVLFRPYGDDHPGFTCASIFRKLYGPTPLIRDLKAEDYRSLSYLSTVNPGFLPVLSATGVSFIPYCPQRVQRQFGLDQGIPVGPQETTSCVADLTAFLKSSAFARWGGESTRVLIPGGHRFGFNTPSMGAYWQRLTRSMVDYVIAGRGDKTPIQKLGFAEWDSARGGWVAYTIHLPDGWRSSVNVVEDRLIMPSKRGKVNKRDAPTDPVFERTPKKSAPTASSSKKVPSKKAKAAKQGKTPLLIPSAAGESTTALVQGSIKSVVAPPKRKTRAGKESKSTPSAPSTAEESTEAPLEETIESTVSPAKKTKVGKESKSTTSVPLAAKESMAAPVGESVEPTVAPSKPKRASPARQAVKKSAASGPSKGQKKASISSSTDEEGPSAAPTPSPPKKKKFTAPLFPLGAAGRTRSKSGPKVVHGSGGSGGDTVVVEDSDVAEEDIDAGPPEEDAPSAAAVDQTEDLGKSAADSPGIGIESMGEDHSSSSGSLFGPDTSIAHVMEGISLFGVTPSLRAIPAGGFVIPAGHFTSEDSPVVEGALMPEEIHAQGLVESGSVVDLGHDAPLEGAGAFCGGCTCWQLGLSSYGKFSLVVHGLGLGVDDAVHVSEEIDEVGITGEVTVVSPPRRPTIEVGSSIDVSSLSSEVAAFLREFDARAPNPHPEQFFWSFNGPLVPFGDFWVPNDCSPYLSRLSAGHSDFTKGFKLSIGLGGPMMSLLGSVLAAMDESSLEGCDQDPNPCMEECDPRPYGHEIKALQHQIALLQDSLARLTAYQDAMTSTGGVVPRSERGGSFLDSLLD
uniref:Aminotransferase-like plant mobile domain-containing protein n=1 Tax=Fagus sylvatica TaxID=28930 RepID=A0A2N9HHS7_FAGSY